MGHPILVAAILLCLVGCQNRKIVDDNPVFGTPPPRTTLDSDTPPLATSSDILQTSAEVPGTATLVNTLDETIVARISGQPVFAADVLRPFRPFIETRRNVFSELPSDQRSIAMQQLDSETTQLLERALPDYIDREVVLQSVYRTLKQEQIDGIEEQIDSLFAERVDTIIKAAELSSKAELEDVLVHPDHELFEKMMLAWRQIMGTAPSTSLSESREAFGKMAMAAEFLRARAKEPTSVNRLEMLDYYQAHAEEYDVPLELKWQQIVVNHEGDKAKATAKMQTILRKLRAGESFDELARENSSGPTATEGGVRDWIEAGSLVDTEIEEKLFELPKGEVSEVFERPDRFEIVRVVDRRGGFRKSFESMQSKIRKTLMADLAQSARENALQKLRDESDIEILLETAKAEPEDEMPANLFRANR
jgi:parvulin-like peptidyl-prolyl isomerase